MPCNGSRCVEDTRCLLPVNRDPAAAAVATVARSGRRVDGETNHATATAPCSDCSRCEPTALRTSRILLGSRTSLLVRRLSRSALPHDAVDGAPDTPRIRRTSFNGGRRVGNALTRRSVERRRTFRVRPGRAGAARQHRQEPGRTAVLICCVAMALPVTARGSADIRVNGGHVASRRRG